MAHPLRLRSFRLVFIGRALSGIGDAVVPAALALAVLRATGSTSALALVLGCIAVPRLLLLPLGGVFADRLNARTMAIATDLFRCAAQGLVGVELLGGDPALGHIAAAGVLTGAASAFAMPTKSPLVAGTVPGPIRQKANAAIGVADSTARLLGPALAGTLIWAAGSGWAFLIDAASFAVSAALLSLAAVARTPTEHRSLREDLLHGWTEVRRRDWYWTSLIAHAAWNGAAAVLLTLGPAVAVHQLGGEQVWVLMLQAGAVGLLVGSLLAGRVRPPRPVLVANLGLATYALPLALLAVAAPAPAVIAAYGLALVALGFLNPVWETTVQAQFPAHALARVTSYDWLCSLAVMPLGYAVAPLAAAAWAPPVPLAVAAAVVALTCLGTAAVPSVRRLAAATDEQPRPIPDDPQRVLAAGAAE